MKKARVQDIAKTAGVSSSTVTRVLSGSGYASEEKRELVLQAAKDLGYDFSKRAVPSPLPQVLVFSPPSHQYQNSLFCSIQECLSMEAQRLGWFCLSYCVTNETIQDISLILQQMQHQNLKGIIFNCLGLSSDVSDLRKLLSALSVPVVMIERFPDIFGINKIHINAKEALFFAVRHLYKQGHRKIAFLSPDTSAEVERARIEGFHFAVSALEIAKSAHFQPIPNYTREAGSSALAQYITAYGMPTAIISADPVMVGISSALYKQGIRVPEDISLVSLDDTNAAIMTPPLTSVAFPVHEIAHIAVGMLQQPAELSQTVSLSTYLVERDSVAPPRQF